MTAVDSLEQWDALAGELRKAGYTVYQMQYAANQPEGFHVWFWLSGRPEVHIVTHNESVQDAIVDYRIK